MYLVPKLLLHQARTDYASNLCTFSTVRVDIIVSLFHANCAFGYKYSIRRSHLCLRTLTRCVKREQCPRRRAPHARVSFEFPVLVIAFDG